MFTFSTFLQNCSSGNLDMKFPPENSQPKQHIGARDSFYTETQTASHLGSHVHVWAESCGQFFKNREILDPSSHK